MRILHLEDRLEDAFLIGKVIKHSGIDASIQLAVNRQEFVSALAENSFDLVLADNGLPGFTSLEALKLLRQKNPDASFICVSGSAREDMLASSIKAGATDFISKDCPEAIVASIRREEEKIRLARMNKGMARLVTAVQELSLARDLETIMSIVRRAARELTGADGATFVLRDGEHCYYAEEYAIEPLWKGQRFPLKICISGWAMLNKQPVVIEDIYKDPRIPAQAYRPTFVKSLAMVPIRAQSPIGAIGNYWARHRMPTADEVELLQALANTTAVAMENVQVYNELEQRVRTRTAELEFANRELEAFSHAVSHDLSAPLRRISSFTGLLVSECGDKLDGNSKQYFDYIKGSADEMRLLITDLLRLSKVSRTQLKNETVNLSALARSITDQLKSSAPDRRVELAIADGLEAEGDEGLLRVVLENLLNNAWKYSTKRDNARIAFEKVTSPEGEPAFCVRDNGAGFEMKYMDKLFQPFQRLHTQTEFPGSGIGLTTVQRVIHRHNGKIWAEAEPEKGAAFFFTVPAKATAATKQ